MTKCPSCDTHLDRRETALPGAMGVALDVCDRCLGVWLPAPSVRHLADLRAVATRTGAFGAALREILHAIEAAIYTDALTGVRNRRSFDLRLPAAISEANGRYRVSLLFFDLDGFKGLNDERGHQEGDRALRVIAQTITKALRPMDHVSRYGGDEFVAILPEADRAETAKVASRVRDAIAKARHDGILLVDSSIGVATYPYDGETPADLLAAADAAMYRVKGERRR